jgi:predicted Ser/Thr protein kinase
LKCTSLSLLFLVGAALPFKLSVWASEKILGQKERPGALLPPPDKKGVVLKTANLADEAVLTPKKFAGLTLEPGQVVQLPSGKKITIIEEVEVGRRGRVYRAKGKKGEIFALKLAKDAEAETLDSFSKEGKKVKALAKGEFRHAQILEEGKDFALKDWIEGVRADQWLKAWDKAGRPVERADVKELWRIFKRAAEQKTYIGDLNPKNLIWTGKDWVIIDSGDLRYDLDAKTILERFQEKMTRRWGKVNPDASKCLFKALRELL